MVPGSHTTRCAGDLMMLLVLSAWPNVPKQHSFLVQSDWHCGRGAIAWAWQSIVPQPSSCPICYEDLDVHRLELSSVFMWFSALPLLPQEDSRGRWAMSRLQEAV
ncbi:hypothetical protein GBA52_025161 [Prunus armeniaca]|nr:hypothetical protein GBA52_025161 [Prunus armeniaca]